MLYCLHCGELARTCAYLSLDLCQPASSKLYIFIVVTLNIVTDLYLILIPVPMLWGAQIPKVKKIGLVVLFSGGIFVMVAGLLRCVLILKVRLDLQTKLRLILRPTKVCHRTQRQALQKGPLGRFENRSSPLPRRVCP